MTRPAEIRKAREEKASPKNPVMWEHLLTDALIGAVFYKMLGGRFRNVLPSNLAMPGAFASQSILAPGASYCSPAQKTELIKIFRRDGCHTCGVRGGRRVIGDHQPPNKVVYGSSQAAEASRMSSTDLTGSFKDATTKAAASLASGRGYSESAKPIMKAVQYAMKVIPNELKEARRFTQLFYPQCGLCSQAQSALMRNMDKASRWDYLVLHPLRPRVWGLAGVFSGLHHHTATELPPPVKRRGGLFRGGFREGTAPAGDAEEPRAAVPVARDAHGTLEGLRTLERLTLLEARQGRLSTREAAAVIQDINAEKKGVKEGARCDAGVEKHL